jgi:hypothetical protein
VDRKTLLGSLFSAALALATYLGLCLVFSTPPGFWIAAIVAIFSFSLGVGYRRTASPN